VLFLEVAREVQPIMQAIIILLAQMADLAVVVRARMITPKFSRRIEVRLEHKLLKPKLLLSELLEEINLVEMVRLLVRGGTLVVEVVQVAMEQLLLELAELAA
jgi:hypothetical protein